MGIFDGIIAEEQNNTTKTSTLIPDNNDEILIIDDQSGDSIFNSNITPADIPDSAISFFDEPKVKDVEISEVKDEFTDNSSLISSDINDSSDKTEETGFGKIDNSDIMSQIKTSDIGNPNDVLVNAISSLESFLAGHEQTIGQKMSTIETKQEEITKLKQDIKVLNEEAKIIAEEKMKVEKMIELFKSQKI